MAKKDLESIALDTIKYAQKEGADQSEVCLVYGSNLSIAFEESSIVKATRGSLTGIGLRVIKDHAYGLGSSSQFKKSLLKDIASDAVSLAKASTPDKAIEGFAPKAKKYPNVQGLYDKTLAEIDSDEVVDDIAIAALNAALERDDSVNVSGEIDVINSQVIIANSNDVLASIPKTGVTVFVSTKVTKDDDVGNAYDYELSRSLKEIHPEKVGKTATEKAFNLLGSKRIKSKVYPLLLNERATRVTMKNILSKGISAYEMDRGTAFFSDQLAEEITSPKISINDNPLKKGGFRSRTFDVEGTPCKNLELVKDGILKTYISDVYTANKLDIPNTGSADKDNYSGNPKPELQQIQIHPGSATKDELFAELGTGLYLESPIFVMSGTNISQQVDTGFWVEKGEIKYPVKNTMLGTTVYDLMKNIKLVGKKILEEGGETSPMILFKKIRFSSGK
jgi:PmbA protein